VEEYGRQRNTGLLWDKLDMLPVNLTPDGKNFQPLRAWPSRGNEVEGVLSPGGFTPTGKKKLR
jgi:hypothetical protein